MSVTLRAAPSDFFLKKIKKNSYKYGARLSNVFLCAPLRSAVFGCPWLVFRALCPFARTAKNGQKSTALYCLRATLVSKRAASSSFASHSICCAPLRSADIMVFLFSSLRFALLFVLGVVCVLFVALRFALLNNKVQTYTVPLSPLTRCAALFLLLRFARIVCAFAFRASGSVLFASFPLLPCARQPPVALPSAGLKTARPF